MSLLNPAQAHQTNLNLLRSLFKKLLIYLITHCDWRSLLSQVLPLVEGSVGGLVSNEYALHSTCSNFYPSKNSSCISIRHSWCCKLLLWKFSQKVNLASSYHSVGDCHQFCHSIALSYNFRNFINSKHFPFSQHDVEYCLVWILHQYYIFLRQTIISLRSLVHLFEAPKVNFHITVLFTL